MLNLTLGWKTLWFLCLNPWNIVWFFWREIWERNLVFSAMEEERRKIFQLKNYFIFNINNFSKNDLCVLWPKLPICHSSFYTQTKGINIISTLKTFIWIPTFSSNSMWKDHFTLFEDLVYFHINSFKGFSYGFF